MEEDKGGNGNRAGYYAENGVLPTVGTNGSSSYCSSENERPTVDTDRNGYYASDGDSKYKEYNESNSQWNGNGGPLQLNQQALVSANHMYNFSRSAYNSHLAAAVQQQPEAIFNAFQHSGNPVHFNGLSNAYQRAYSENPSHLPSSYPPQSIPTSTPNLPHYPQYQHRPSRFIQFNDQIVAFSQPEQQSQQEGLFYFFSSVLLVLLLDPRASDMTIRF